MRVRLAFFDEYEREVESDNPFSEVSEKGYLWVPEQVVPRQGERVLVHEYIKRLLVQEIVDGELPPEGEYEVALVTYTFAADGELRALVFCCQIG